MKLIKFITPTKRKVLLSFLITFLIEIGIFIYFYIYSLTFVCGDLEYCMNPINIGISLIKLCFIPILLSSYIIICINKYLSTIESSKRRFVKLFFLGALIGFLVPVIYSGINDINHDLPNFLGDIILFPGWAVGLPLLDFLYDNYCQIGPGVFTCRGMGDHGGLDRIAFFTATTVHLIFYGGLFVFVGMLREKWKNEST